MFGRFLALFRGSKITISGVDALKEGFAKKFNLGDPMAGGRQIILCRVDGELLALDAICPHEGGRIAEGPLVNGKTVMCPLHLFQFDPKTGEVLIGSCPKAKVYKVKQRPDECDVFV